jgi:hypothetical protein
MICVSHPPAAQVRSALNTQGLAAIFRAYSVFCVPAPALIRPGGFTPTSRRAQRTSGVHRTIFSLQVFSRLIFDDWG